jgi:copper chaperone NosL
VIPSPYGTPLNRSSRKLMPNVQDMAQRDQDGQFPEQAWIPAQDAWYLIYSRYTGGMGTIDALPFSQEQAAKDFQQQHGGQLVRFADMPENYIFGAVALP